MECPVCKASMKINGDLWECSNFVKCPTFAFRDNKYLIVDFEKVGALLHSPYLKTNKLAQSFSKFFEQKRFLTSNQLVYIIGTINPKGRPTLQQLIFSRTGVKPSVGKIFKITSDEEPEQIKLPTKPQNDIATDIPVIETEKIIVRGDEPIVKTQDFSYIDYSFEAFNPLQSVTVHHIEQDKNIVVASATSSGKCLVNSLIATVNGLIWLTSVNENEDIYSFDVKNKNRVNKKVSHKFCLGEQPTIKITLDNGNIIEGTYEHPLLTFNGKDLVWKRLCELNIGDYLTTNSKNLLNDNLLYVKLPEIVNKEKQKCWEKEDEDFVFTNKHLSLSCLANKLQRTEQSIRMKLWRGCKCKKYKKINLPTYIDEDFAWLLGLLIGDGGLTIKNTINLTNTNKKIINKATDIVNHYNLQFKTYDDVTYTINSCEFYQLLCALSLCHLADKKTIPDAILKSRKSVVYNFIGGLIDSDGYIDKNSFEYSTASSDLANKLQQLFNYCGIIATKSKKIKKYNKKVQYRLFITGVELEKLQEFNDYIVSDNKKINYTATKSLNDIIPISLTLIENSKLHWGYRKGYRKCSRLFLLNNLDKLDNYTSKLVKNIIDNELYFAKVSEITKSKNIVYDVTVPETSLFIANGVFSHNTIVAEQFIAPIIEGGEKAIYISPLKALTQEKYDDWTNKDHTFSKYRIEIITGDYILSADRVNEINQADIILMTSEMLASRTIKVDYEKNRWLKEVGVMVIDECHLLGMESRGDHLESAMMRFSAINQECKIIALSATMPNVKEIASWLTLLNGKKSLLIKSDWRPVQLDIHYEAYLDSGTYATKEDNKAKEVIRLLRYYKDDKFLVFVHTKATGRRIKERIERELQEKVEFHSADLTKAIRNRLEKSFKSREGGLRILISTSTIAYGCNLPARRAIIVGVHRGLEEVTSMDIIQQCGRSGRYGIDIKGDAYVLVPSTDKEFWVQRISKPEDILSRMIQAKTIAFHAITEIVRGAIRNRDELLSWYERSLAFFQRKARLFADNVEDIETYLTDCNSMKIEDDVYVPTNLGRIAAWMYFKPHDVKHWFSAFSIMNEQRIEIEWDAVWLSWALSMESPLDYLPAEVDSYANVFYSKCDQRGIKISSKHLLPALGIYHALTGERSVYNSLIPIKRALVIDIDRIIGAVKMIDALYAKWGYPSDTYKVIKKMISYEVGRHLVDLCSIRNIGKVKATQLYAKGITTYRDLLKLENRSKIEEILKKKTEDSLDHARELLNV